METTILVNATHDSFAELRRRMDRNHSTMKEELGKDPRLAKTLYVLSGFELKGSNN